MKDHCQMDKMGAFSSKQSDVKPTKIKQSNAFPNCKQNKADAQMLRKNHPNIKYAEMEEV